MLERQLHLGGAQDLIKEVAPVQNGDGATGLFNKPNYGLWTSTWISKEVSSAWVEWCRSEHQGWLENKTWWLLTPQADAKVYTIHNLKDLTVLLEQYQRRFTGRLAYATEHFPCLDFERLSQDYDAIHLTERGQGKTRLSFPANLYGWDSESTLWFRWCFTSVEQIAVPEMVLSSDEIEKG